MRAEDFNVLYPRFVLCHFKMIRQSLHRAAELGALFALGILPATAVAQIAFEDVSDAAGMDNAAETYGASFGDFNSDGRLDIVLSNHRTQGSLYINRGDGRFLDLGSQVKTWIYKKRADTHGGAFADFDNDGDQDLLLTTGTGNPNQLLVNEYGELVDRTAAYGLNLGGRASRMAVWIDLNRDLKLDVIFANRRGSPPIMVQSGNTFTLASSTYQLNCSNFHYAQFIDITRDGVLDFLCGSPEALGSSVFPQAVYNMRYTPFRDVTNGMPQFGQAVDSAVADFNGDLREDVFALHGIVRPSGVAQTDQTIEAMLLGGKKGLRFISRGSVAFEIHWNQNDELAGVPNLRVGAGNFNPGTTTFRLDPNDPRVAGQPTYSAEDTPLLAFGYEPSSGEWTIVHDSIGASFSNAYLIARSSAPISNLRATGMWPSDKPVAPRLLLHTDNGFVDNTDAAGLSAPIACVSAAAGDFDNDMDVDLYLACRTGPANIANLLLANRGNGVFDPVPDAGGAAGPVGLAVTSGAGTADSVITGDWDNDGALDLFVANGLNMRPLDVGGPHKLYRNLGNGNHWIQLELAAAQSTRDGLGARITATAAGTTQVRFQNGGYHRWSQHSNRIHFGLAQANTVDLRIVWPSGRVDLHPGVAADRIYRARENNGLEVLSVGPGQLLPCGQPDFDRLQDNAVVLWKDCITQHWKMRGVAADANTLYSGSLKSSADFVSVSANGLESDDQLDTDPHPARIAFVMNVAKNSMDGFTFKMAPGATACMQLTTDPPGKPVYFGPLRRTVVPPFSLQTGAACTP